MDAPTDRQRARVVVVFVMDDMRYDDLAWMPRTQKKLVDRGVSFTSNYAASPQCCPSRASLLTGQYPRRTGVVTNLPPHNIEAFDDTSTIGTWLTADGVSTGFVGKYLNGYGRDPFDFRYVPPGWGMWRVPYRGTYDYLGQRMSVDGRRRDDSGIYSTSLYGNYAARFLRARLVDDDARVYLQVNFVAPHGGPPKDPSDPADLGDLATPYVQPRFRGDYRGPTLPRSSAYDEPAIADKPALGRLPRLSGEDIENIKRSMQQRRDSLLAADAQIERLVDLVLDRVPAHEAGFVFGSDNGFFEGEHRITRGKRSHYEPASHVPLVVRGPGFRPGTRCHELSGVHDIAPTVLAWTGASAGPRHVIDGRPLQRVAAADDDDGRGRAIRLEIADDDGHRIIRGVVSPDRWKYVEIRGGFVEMYDLDADPHETRNRADDPRFQRKRAELARLLERVFHPQQSRQPA